LKLLGDKQVALGAIDVATDRIETPEEVAAILRRALAYVPLERMEASTNCGMAPLDHDVATAKLAVLAAGAALINKENA
jgi:5-methyltetrahydropteroyltriglutamate--homocysteine methyltransferase